MLLLAPLAALIALGGCSGEPVKTLMMGEQVQLGSFSFTVLESDWLADLPGTVGPRLPKRRFLAIRISASNQGTRELHVPLLRLENEKGESFAEEEKGDGLEDWWGLIRPVSPGSNENRRILFDVEPGEYKLHLSDGGDPDKEKTAVVSIPFRLRSSDPLPLPEPKVE
jgi:hypothetical protein